MTVLTLGLPISRFCLTPLLLGSIFSSPLLADTSSATENLQLGIHQVGSWRATDDSNLILKDHQNNQYLAILKPPCTGLEKAKSIAFTSHSSSSLDKSSSVVLPSGKRCPFQSFTRQPATE